jgi:hypothetical protein
MAKSKKDQCCKCRTENPTLHIRQAYYCQTCFMFQFVGKFRSILIRLRNGNRKKGKVLLACSGGPSSMALVHLTKNIMHTLPNEKKKIQVVPEAIVCHIDESPLWGDMVSERPRMDIADPFCRTLLQPTCSVKGSRSTIQTLNSSATPSTTSFVLRSGPKPRR